MTGCGRRGRHAQEPPRARQRRVSQSTWPPGPPETPRASCAILGVPGGVGDLGAQRDQNVAIPPHVSLQSETTSGTLAALLQLGQSRLTIENLDGKPESNDYCESPQTGTDPASIQSRFGGTLPNQSRRKEIRK